ncbi:MAG: NAD-dependent epimerase/dehydratase [Parcubacteria group bacterium]|nr:NAD-dependent epimerase/dehydratase [Parcubacteria group bacterium]
MSKILVTGGAGYIGSLLVPMLLNKGHEVVVLDNLTYGINGLLPCFLDKNFKFVKGDIQDEALVKTLVSDIDTVIHLAAIVGYPACAKDEDLAYAVNLTGTENIGKNLREDQSIIYASTASNYGVVVGELCTEETPLKPLTAYAKSKTMAEKFLLDNCKAVGFRFATAFGVSPRLRLDLMVNDFIYQALHTKDLTVYEKGFKRTFIHVYDIARSFLFALENLEKMTGNVYNVGSESMNFTKEELINKIKEQVDFNIEYKEIGKDADQRDYAVSYRKIAGLGFDLSINIEQGIKELVNVLQYIKDDPYFKNV